MLEYINKPIEMVLNGTKFIVSSLPITEIFATAEKRILEMFMDDTKLQLSFITDSKERSEFLRNIQKPAGMLLKELAINYLSTVSGMFDILLIGLNKHQKLSEIELMTMLQKLSEEEKTNLFEHMMGLSMRELTGVEADGTVAKVSESTEGSENVNNTEKKT